MNSLAPARRVQMESSEIPILDLGKKLHAVLALGGCAAVAGAALAVATPWAWVLVRTPRFTSAQHAASRGADAGQLSSKALSASA